MPQQFKVIWPRILTYIIENPDASYRQIWNAFAKKIDDVFSYEDFRDKLKEAGITRKKVKQAVSTSALVDKALASFADTKKEFAENHMRRIHKKLEEVHTVVASIQTTDETVGRVLELTSKLHREGRLAYGIDEENRGDQKAMNLAVMIGFTPQKKEEASAKVVEVSSQ